MQTPVVFLVFNRPDTTEQVFTQIRQARPSTLFVIADGPRPKCSGEAERCQAVRNIVQQVDWDCKLLTNFSAENLGCKHRVASGLNWVFSQVEEAIILEDDCLPTSSFFPFCETLLKRYREDSRIMMISGTNFRLPLGEYPYSYYFSRLVPMWGWATWRRAWQLFDISMQSWPEFKHLNLLYGYCEDAFEQAYWTERFDEVYEGVLDSWGYIWTYTCWRHNGLSILPTANLISNIGYGTHSTHTAQMDGLANLPTTDLWNIEHPPFIAEYRQVDRLFFDYYRGGKSIRRNLGLIRRGVSELLQLLRGKVLKKATLFTS